MRHTGTLTQSHQREGGQRPEPAQDVRDRAGEGVKADPEAEMDTGQRARSLKSKLEAEASNPESSIQQKAEISGTGASQEPGEGARGTGTAHISRQNSSSGRREGSRSAIQL